MKNGAYTHSEKRPKGNKNGMRLHPGLVQGEKNPFSKLNNSQIKEIRQLALQKLTYSEIASRFNVCSSTIGQIIRGEIWNHVL